MSYTRTTLAVWEITLACPSAARTVARAPESRVATS